ncbi:MAG: dTDP-4-dehydrorhamnose reductase [Alphaproteobacteria bacterium]|nr:dTDP-4-dehydrorhamnose reductase [Alphaproteobacteria bacterium]
MKRVMLLGAKGQVGQAIQHQELPNDWQLMCYDHSGLDITNHRAVRAVIGDIEPDIIINPAAMTNVDKAEKDESAAIAINFHAVANLAAICSARDIPLIHLSTDFVFDGESSRPYLPDDQMHPINIYGQTKMLGEEAVRNELAWHVILRISWVFSEFSNNLLTNTLKLIDSHDKIKIVTDQYNCPTYASDVAAAIVSISKEVMAGKADGFGVFHFCGAPPVPRYEFVEAVMAAYAPYAPKLPELIPALSSDFPGFAARPAYSALDCAKIKEVYNIDQSSWKDGLNRAIDCLMRQRKADRAL